MNRHLLPLFLLPLLLLTGCNRSAAPKCQPVANGFCCTFSGNYGETEVAGTIRHVSAGMLTAELTTPEELRGLSMTWDGEQVCLSMFGMELPLDVSNVPEAALGKRILRALDEVTYQNTSGTLTDDGRVRTDGTLEDGRVAFSLYSDAETGALLSLSIPSESISLCFSDFTKM